MFGSTVQHMHHPRGLCYPLGGWTLCQAVARGVQCCLVAAACPGERGREKEGITLPFVLVGNIGSVWEAQSSPMEQEGKQDMGLQIPSKVV